MGEKGAEVLLRTKFRYLFGGLMVVGLLWGGLAVVGVDAQQPDRGGNFYKEAPLYCHAGRTYTGPDKTDFVMDDTKIGCRLYFRVGLTTVDVPLYSERRPDWGKALVVYAIPKRWVVNSSGTSVKQASVQRPPVTDQGGGIFTFELDRKVFACRIKEGTFRNDQDFGDIADCDNTPDLRLTGYFVSFYVDSCFSQCPPVHRLNLKKMAKDSGKGVVFDNPHYGKL